MAIETSPLVTIGIPVYNAEDFIERCLLSTLNQTYMNIEVLLIDVCGNDRSIEIAKHISESHQRGECIRIIKHQQNMGVANARNTIVKEARGKYLYFMDSDDTIKNTTIDLLYRKAEEYKAESVWASYQCISGDSKLESVFQYPNIFFQEEDKLAEFAWQDLNDHLQASIWNILFDVNFIRSSRVVFEQHGYFDDLIFQYRIRPKIKRAVLLSDITYYYYKRENSISNFQARTSFKRKEAIDAIEVAECLKDCCKSTKTKTYYDVQCTKIMRQCFFYSNGILCHRKMMDLPVKNREIRNIMKHPLNIWQIIQFKHYRVLNLFFYILGIIPSSLMVTLVRMISYKRGWR